MTEVPYEIELDEVQWNMLQEAIADDGQITFTKNGKRIPMETIEK